MKTATKAVIITRLRRIERRPVQFTDGSGQHFACNQFEAGQHEKAQCNHARNCGPTDHLQLSSHGELTFVVEHAGGIQDVDGPMPVIHSNFGVVVAMSFVLPFACLPQAGCAGRSAKVAVPTPRSDAEIVDMLLTHNEVAMRIVVLCSERAVRAELKEYCSTGTPRLAVQREQLGQWRKSPRDPLPRHDDQYDTFLRRMTEASGDDFDEAAVRAIRVHAREGLTETTACEERASDTRLKQSCGEMKAAQQRALENARKWICEWFRDCAERVR
jgi:hypothetical protein